MSEKQTLLVPIPLVLLLQVRFALLVQTGKLMAMFFTAVCVRLPPSACCSTSVTE